MLVLGITKEKGKASKGCMGCRWSRVYEVVEVG